MSSLVDLSNMAGMGQFNMNRKPGNMQPPKPKGREDEEPSMYFRDPSSVFRPDKEMMPSGSPSQLTGSNMFGANMYSQPPTSAGEYLGMSSGMGSGMGNITLQQRGMSNPPPFQRNITPTSIAPNFGGIPGIPPQQTSPNSLSGNRNLFGLGQRGIIQTSQAALNSQLKRPNSSIASSIMSSQSSSTTTSSILSGFGRSSGLDQPSLDLSEFPTLGNRSSAPPNPQPIARNYVGMVSKPVQEPTPEFQIQQEDFPALPGTQNPPSSSANDSSRKTPTSGALSSYDAAVNKDGAKFPGDKMGTGGAQQTRRGIQTHPDGTVSNIPHGMVIDQFGMVGLLTFIRAAETDPNLVALAPGIDLTTLGLNLNSPENLYSTFQSPWADSPCRPQDIDFHVPQEYLTNIFIREKLAPIKLNRYGEDLLFFLFYMNGGDVLQLASAAELYNRDWRYHKEERVWITRAPGIDPQLKTNSFEKGTYYFFDAQNWRKVLKEFRLEYDKLEERPHLPPTLHHNPNQPPVMAH